MYHLEDIDLHYLNVLNGFSSGVPLYAAVSSVCDSESGWFYALLSECTDGQVHAQLPG